VQRQMAALRNGDSVSVTGTVQEQYDVTRLGGITAVTRISGGNTVPAPVVRTAGSLNVGNGNLSAEPYEGMLVRLTNLTVTDVYPTYSDATEYSVSDGTGAAIVQRSGRNKYSNVPADTLSGKTILREGDTIASLTGIVYYSFNQYKFVPRTDADFVGVVLTSVAERAGTGIPGAFELSQNYPNPFNPSTTIRYAIPATGMTSLKIYNILGQEVATLVNEVLPAGVYTVRFDASSLASGLYFFRIQSGSFSQVKKMVLVK
jgi:predicted extracellular nuclease